MAQLDARPTCDQDVADSTPTGSAFFVHMLTRLLMPCANYGVH